MDFTVSGRVMSPDNAGMSGLVVELMDCNVGADPTPLTRTNCDADGSYRCLIESLGEEYLAERNKDAPDFQTRVLVGDKPVAVSEVRYGAGDTEVGLDLALPAGTVGLPSEHESLLASVAARYPGSLATLKEGESRQDISYLANRTGWDARAVAMAAQSQSLVDGADELGHETIDPAFYYALFRAGAPTDSAALYRSNPGTVLSIWKTAIDQRVIPEQSDDDINRAHQVFTRGVAMTALHAPPQVGLSTVSDMLAPKFGDDVGGMADFVEIALRHRDGGEAMWTEVEQHFNPEIANWLRLQGQLAVLTLNNTPLAQKLRTQHDNVTDAVDLLDHGLYAASAWEPLLEGVEVPHEIIADRDEDRPAVYAKALAEQLTATYPTATVAAMITSDAIPMTAPAEIATRTAEFLRDHRDEFVIGAEPIGAYIIRKQIAEDVDPTVVSQVARIHRVWQLSTSVDSVVRLLDARLESAQSVVEYRRSAFVTGYGTSLGGDDTADAIYSRAVTISATLNRVVHDYLAGRSAPVLGSETTGPVVDPTPAFANGGAPAPPGPGGTPVLPQATLEALFKSLDYGTCSDCQSTTSPAAYLVDLLDFIDHPKPANYAGDWVNPQYQFSLRRPDIFDLPLTCANTNTALPYIDLVNETLSYYVKNTLSITGFIGHTTDDNARSADLVAAAAFGDDAATQAANVILKKTWGPAPLPFHRELAELRGHLDSLGVTLADVLATFSVTAGVDPTGAPTPGVYRYAWRDVLAEQIGLSRGEYTVLTNHELPELGPPNYGAGVTADCVRRLYAFPDAEPPANVPAALKGALETARRLDVSLAELADLLRTQFVNPAAALIPLAEALKLEFAKIAELHDGLIANTVTAADVQALLPAQLDPAPFDGDVAAWLADPVIYQRLMSLIVIAPVSLSDAATMGLRYADPAHKDDPVDSVDLVRLARFVRLWRKLGLSVDTTDRLLNSLMPAPAAAPADALADLDSRILTALPRIAVAYATLKALGLSPDDSLDDVLALWAPMSTIGATSPYARMFLNSTATVDPRLGRDQYGDVLTAAAGVTIGDVKPLLCAGMQLSAAEFDAIVAPAEFGGLGYTDATVLTVANLTTIYRRGFLARALQISVIELLHLISRTGLDPFAAPDWDASGPPPILRFATLVSQMAEAGATPSGLLYQLWDDDLTGMLAPPTQLVTALAGQLRDSFAAVDAQFALAATEPDTATLSKLLTAVMGDADTQLLLGVLNQTLIIATPYTSASGELPVPVRKAAKQLLSYDDLAGNLSFAGRLDAGLAVAVKTAAAGDPGLIAAISALTTATAARLDPMFARYEVDLDTFTIAYRAKPAQRPALLAGLIKGLSRQRKLQQALSATALATGTSPALAAALLGADTPGGPIVLNADASTSDPANADLIALEQPGLTVVFDLDNVPPNHLPALGDPNSAAAGGALDYGPELPNKLPIANGGLPGIAAKWDGYLRAPTSGPYKLRLVAPQSTTITITVAGSTDNTGAIHVRLTGGELAPISIAATGLAGTVQLQWITTGTGWQPIPATALFSATHTTSLTATIRRYQRGTSLATSLNLTPAELVWLATRPDLLAPAPQAWLNHPANAADKAAWALLAKALDAVLEYTTLKRQTSWRPGALLKLAQTDPTSSSLASSVATAAGWKEPDLTALLTHFAATATITTHLLTRVAAAVRLATMAGIDNVTLIAAATNDPTTVTVAALEAALRARHDAADWRSAITPINNGIRIQQRDALVAHILTQANDRILAGLGIAATANRRATADDLYGYFLMDVQMQPCMQTSRIRLALSAVQLFVQRCLCGLEPGITAALIDPDNQWPWRKTYRIWQARWEVWAWPENVMDVAIRDDRSPIYTTALSALKQGNPDDDTKASIYLDYLSGLEQVAQLHPTGLWYTPKNTAGVPIAHVVARDSLQQYYHCRFDGTSWMPWEQIPLKIDSDVPVVPYVWKGRLLLLWGRVHFATGAAVRDASPKASTAAQPGTSLADTPLSGLLDAVAAGQQSAARLSYSLKLHFSRFYNRKWQPPVASDTTLDLGTWSSTGFAAYIRRATLMPLSRDDDPSLYIRVGGIPNPTLFDKAIVLHNTYSVPGIGNIAWPKHFSPSGHWRTRLVGADEVTMKYDDKAATGLVYSGPRLITVRDSQADIADPWNAPFIGVDYHYPFYVTPLGTPMKWGLATKNWDDLLGVDKPDFKITIPEVVVPFEPPKPIPDPITALGDPIAAQQIINQTNDIRVALPDSRSIVFGGRDITAAGSLPRSTGIEG